MRVIALVTIAILLVSACSREEPPAPDEGVAPDRTASPPGDGAALIARALADPDRLAADRERDAMRRPGEVLAFFGIKPGMSVLDLYSGGGYYTEILSHVVGRDGHVWAHTNTPYLKFVKDELGQRFTPGRLENVKRVTMENNQLDLPANAFDAVLMVLTYHDIWYMPEDVGWEPINVPRLLTAIHEAMRPGAVLGIVDHVAAPGTPAEESGNTVHRIDPELIKQQVTASGFVFEAESDALRNPNDDYTVMVFDPAVRGKTDRAVLRFRKPGAL